MRKISFFLFLLFIVSCSSDDTGMETPMNDDVAQDDSSGDTNDPVDDDTTDDDTTDDTMDTESQSSQEVFEGLIITGAFWAWLLVWIRESFLS
ncbi:MAG: hypothetical protein AAF039_00745 [Bacteroidota bacterium]